MEEDFSHNTETERREVRRRGRFVPFASRPGHARIMCIYSGQRRCASGPFGPESQRHYTTGTANSLRAEKEWPRDQDKKIKQASCAVQ